MKRSGSNIGEKSIRMRVAGQGETKYFSKDNINMTPVSESAVSDIQRSCGKITADARKYRRQGEVTPGLEKQGEKHGWGIVAAVP